MTCQNGISVELRLGPKRMGRFAVGREHGPPEVALPVLRAAADALMAEGVRQAGTATKCRAGCAACCRQLVPLSGSEARDLRRRVAELPEPARSRVLARFEASSAEMAEAGLAELMMDTGSIPPEGLEDLGQEYLRAGIDCPLLEEERCVLYEHRPMACRQHAVSSEPSECRRGGRVRRIRPAGRFMNAVLDRLEGTGWVALPLAMSADLPEPQDRAPGEWVADAWRTATRGQGSVVRA